MTRAGWYFTAMQTRRDIASVSTRAAFVLALSLVTVLVTVQAADAPKKKGKGKAAEAPPAPAEPAAPPYQAVMARFDKDGNEVLSSAERDALRAAFAKESSLKALDTNGDGKLDEGEINRVEDPPKAKAQKKKKDAETK